MAEKKLAYRRVVKNEDNDIRLMYVDAATGQPITSLEGYTLLDQGTGGVTGDLDLEKKDKKTAAEEVVDPLLLRDNTTTEGGEGWQYNFAGSMPRNPSNNYGFIDKNIAIKALGKLGIPGKALNLAINGNNIEATNAARETLGLGPMSTKEAISSLVAGRDGYVADVKIGDEQYSVGLKAMDRAGRTTLTPMEARNRSLHTGFGLVEATPAERKQSIADARANPDIQKSRGGVLGKIGRAAVGAVTGGLAGAAGAVAGEVGSLRGPRGTYEEPVSRPAAPWGFGPQANPVQTYRTTPHGELLGPTMPSNMSVPDVGAINSPAFGAAGARGMQGFDVGPGGMANVASPAFGARGASEMQGYAPPAGPSPAFGARGASEYTPGAGMRTDVPTPTARPAQRSRGLQDVADVTRTGPRFSYNMGPNRPNAPEQGIQEVVGKAVNSVLGPGATVSIVSGQEGDLPQYGSSRHKTGMAADIQVFDANGRQITMENNPEVMQDIARAAAGLGARGIGFGESYMGGVSMHLDTVEPGPGQAHTWGDGKMGAGAMRDELVEDMGEHVARERHVSQGMFPSQRPDVITAEEQLMGRPGEGSFRAAQQEGFAPTFAEQTKQEIIDEPSRIARDERPQSRQQDYYAAIYDTAKALGATNEQANLAAAQASLETGYGQSVKGNNHFGIKAGSKYVGDTVDFTTHEVLDGQRVKMNDTFRAYDDMVGSVKGYMEFMQENFPDSWNATNMPDALAGLNVGKYGKYATDEDYLGKVGWISDKFGLDEQYDSDFGRVAGGGSITPSLSKTTDASSFGSGFSSGFDRESGDSYGGFSTSRSSNYGSSSARSGQSRAGVSSENRSGGYNVGRSGESSFGGFSAGSLGGSASGRGSGYGSTGSGGYSSFSRESGDSYGAGSSSGWSGGGYSGGSSGGRSSGPSSSSPAGGSQAAGGWSGGGRSSSSGGGSYSGGSAKDSGEHSSGSGGFGGTNV